MIDLKNTYIVNDKGELRDLYLREAKEQGYKTHFMGTDFDVLHIGSGYEMVIHGVSGSNCNMYTSDRKKITLADLKPQTKTVYEKIDVNSDGGAFWEVAKVFAEEETNTLVARTNPHEALTMSWMNIKDNDELLRQYKKGMIYRKVEKEIDWKDEVKLYIESVEYLSKNDVIKSVYNGDQAEDDERWDSEFIGMCHLVASLTDKPE